MKYDYKEGGRVKISGRWYEIIEHPHGRPSYAGLIALDCDKASYHDFPPRDFIEGYEPPKPQEWLSVEDFRRLMNVKCSNLLYELNAALVAKYGEPPQ